MVDLREDLAAYRNWREFVGFFGNLVVIARQTRLILRPFHQQLYFSILAATKTYDDGPNRSSSRSRYPLRRT